MRIGQTSFFNFGSQILASVLGFAATVLVTNMLGSGVFGTYALVVAVVIWLKTVAIMGVRSAVMKRLSEEGEDDQYITAGALLLVVILTVLSLILIPFSSRLDAYIGQPLTFTVIALTWASALLAFTTGVLQGQRLVHLASVLRPLNIGIRSIVQIGAVMIGLGLAGILGGFAAGCLFAALIGILLFVKAGIARPQWCHFRSLLTYARFSWLGRLSSRTFSSMDTVILGVFVGVSLIGIYEVAWNLASMLAVFATAIRQTLFPEISLVASKDDMAEVTDLLEQGLAYAGLFLLPGLVGSAVVGDLVLRVYGSEFSQGHLVLVLLVFSRLLYGYADQLLTVLNGIDRPDLSFRINGLFIVVNLGLNWVLVWQYGWVGAAVATSVSAAVSLVLAYWYVNEAIDGAPIPVAELGRQVFAATVMGSVVYLPRTVLSNTLPAGLALVVLGVGTYFLILLAISKHFRRTVRENLPADIYFGL